MYETSARLTLADFLYSRLGPRSKQRAVSDYQRHRTSQNIPTHDRAPKFIRNDVGKSQYGNNKEQLNLAVSSFRQALNNIKDIKESLFHDIFFKKPRGKIPSDDVGTYTGSGPWSEDVPIKGSQLSQTNYLAFRPSLSDPLRPAVKIIRTEPAGRGSAEGNKDFSPPRERTPIDVAVRGQKVLARKPTNVEIQTQSYTGDSELPVQEGGENVFKGRLRVPVERTRIDTAIFANDVQPVRALHRSNEGNLSKLLDFLIQAYFVKEHFLVH